MPVAVTTIAVALLPVVVMAVASFGGPPVIQRLLVLVLTAMPETVVGFERVGVLGVARVEGGRRERRVRGVGVVHGVRRMVAHGLRRHRWRHGWVW